MIRLENFKIGEWGQILRDGEKIVLLIGGDAYAVILYETLFVKKFSSDRTAPFVLETIEEFAKTYKRAWTSRVDNREAIDNLTISF